ncbi:MAG: 3-dehydroquinate synthase II [Candidatus Thermoplasmatota archaeon]|nr:3-dehydroquinate synthase II [Candidatus Thermoplasmatota archaeon]
MKKIIWIKAEDIKKKKILTTALESNFLDIVLSEKTEKKFEKLGVFNTIVLKGNELFSKSSKIGEYIRIKSNEDLEYAKKLANKFEYLVISTENWKVIPIENLIAYFQDTNTKILAEARNIEDAKLFLETLEKGTDGVLVNTDSASVIKDLKVYIEKLSEIKLKLVNAKIVNIKPIAAGERVCIDTCSLLKVGEGLLVGSQASALFLVHSETLSSEYVEARPFRVNAGSLHSYILLPDGKTKYLSELRAGDEVLIVSSEGSARAATIGRVKIETRPLILIEAEHARKRYQVILQNAETIRLVSEEDIPSVTELEKDDKVLIFLSDGARHFGTLVKETIIEK